MIICRGSKSGIHRESEDLVWCPFIIDIREAKIVKLSGYGQENVQVKGPAGMYICVKAMIQDGISGIE
jgi:hypothetical protein